MAEDIKENEMNPVSSVDYVRGVKGMDSVLIALDNLFSSVVGDKGSFDYDNKTLIDNMTTSGVYNHGNSIVGTNGYYGILLIMKSNAYVAQIDFGANARVMFRFSADNGTTWTTWKYLTFT